VLSKSTFFFPARETTFVVGKSGSGKSTLGNLLMRFYEPTAGRILIAGTSIGELDINLLRNNITLVQQQSILFNETIFRNISFGQRDYL
jgi:ATP-binding cassette, subfamily B (MDR/TAP), member 1